MKTQIECVCTSKEHQVELVMENYEDTPFLFMNVHLTKHEKWYQRIWHAVKFVFGYRCKYGDFDEVMFDKENAEKFIEVLATYLHKIEYKP